MTSQSGYTSTSFTNINFMTVVPTAGTYWCTFTSSVQLTTGGDVFQLWMALNNVQSTTAGQNYNDAEINTVHLEWIVTTPGGQPITVQWVRASGSGSATIGTRTLFCIQIQ